MSKHSCASVPSSNCTSAISSLRKEARAMSHSSGHARRLYWFECTKCKSTQLGDAMSSHFSSIAAAACLACTMSSLQAVAGSTLVYSVTKTVALGSPDRWDLLVFDPASHKVFIAHGDRVTVVDGGTGSIIGNVEGLQGGAHGVAIVPGTERGYTDDGHAGTAASFDLDKLNLIKTIKADADTDAIVFDPTSGHIFVVDGDPGKLTVIDPKSDSAVATINVGGKLETAVAGGNAKFK